MVFLEPFSLPFRDLSIYLHPIMKRPLKIDSICVCGHELGDHRNKRPHACMEPSSTRPGHSCSCIGFSTPNSEGTWAGSLIDPAASEHAERAAADMALEGALRSIDLSLPGDGFSDLS